MYILGISCFYHDSAAVLLKDGILIAASEEERFSRIKHDPSFPMRAIAFCLKKAGITADELSYVVFYEKPFLKFERLFLNSIQYIPSSMTFFKTAMKEWFFDKIWIKSHIATRLGIDPKKLLFSEHHLSHMASAFYPSPYEKSALLSIDAVGEWTTTSWGVGEGTNITIKEEIRYPHSLGLLYTAFTVFTGFEAHEGEYKLMGLAPYGKPKYVKKIYQLLNKAKDGSFRLEEDFFSYQYNIQGVYTKQFEELFGVANKNSEEIIPYYADIAASIQYVLEEILLGIAEHIYKKTKLEKLCFAGGVALNSKANWMLLSKSPFKEIYIQPSAGDPGGALGAALWAYHNVLGHKRSFVMEHAYFGAEESSEIVEKILKKENIVYRKIKKENSLIQEVSEKISKGKVIGWVQGAFEWGPRALGNRSILADPRSKKMKELVNRKIKFREGFRPFAPSVLYEEAEKYFMLGNKKNQYPLQFMLHVVPVIKKKQSQLGAITHVDGTARPQLVKKEVNKKYHQLISAFGGITGVPVLLNTSFNLKGEPMVNTTKEALSTFYRSEIDLLVVGNYIIEKK